MNGRIRPKKSQNSHTFAGLLIRLHGWTSLQRGAESCSTRSLFSDGAKSPLGPSFRLCMLVHPSAWLGESEEGMASLAADLLSKPGERLEGAALSRSLNLFEVDLERLEIRLARNGVDLEWIGHP